MPPIPTSAMTATARRSPSERPAVGRHQGLQGVRDQGGSHRSSDRRGPGGVHGPARRHQQQQDEQPGAPAASDVYHHDGQHDRQDSRMGVVEVGRSPLHEVLPATAHQEDRAVDVEADRGERWNDGREQRDEGQAQDLACPVPAVERDARHTHDADDECQRPHPMQWSPDPGHCDQPPPRPARRARWPAMRTR